MRWRCRPLMFLSMARVPLERILNWPFLAAYAAGVAIVFLLAVAVAKLVFPNRMAALALHGYGATFGNSGYMGIPLFLAAFGTDGALPAAIVTVLQTALVNALVILLVEIDLKAEAGPWRALATRRPAWRRTRWWWRRSPGSWSPLWS